MCCSHLKAAQQGFQAIAWLPWSPWLSWPSWLLLPFASWSSSVSSCWSPWVWPCHDSSCSLSVVGCACICLPHHTLCIASVAGCVCICLLHHTLYKYSDDGCACICPHHHTSCTDSVVGCACICPPHHTPCTDCVFGCVCICQHHRTLCNHSAVARVHTSDQPSPAWVVPATSHDLGTPRRNPTAAARLAQLFCWHTTALQQHCHRAHVGIHYHCVDRSRARTGPALSPTVPLQILPNKGRQNIQHQTS